MRPVSAHQTQTPAPARAVTAPATAERARGAPATPAELTTVVRTYCSTCHNDRARSGNLSLEGFDVATAAHSPATIDTSEKMIRKLRAKMMPPPGMRRPADESLQTLVETLEAILDQAAAANPNPGHRSFQRLNRAEYARAVRDLLALDINAGDFLPLDTMSANFDNIADVQALSPTLLDGYLKAAAEVSRLAVGNPTAAASETTYPKSRTYSQWEQVEGAPYGTRGGISVVHNFPADGEYAFKMAFQHTTTGGVSGSTTRGEQIEVSINGERVALMAMDQFVSTSDPQGVNLETETPIFVKAGPQRVSAAFIRQFDGPVEDLLAPHDWSIVDTEIGDKGYGITALPHMKALVIAGPTKITGVSETPSRRKIFTCRPAARADERGCAEKILSRLAAAAYRRPLTATDVRDLLSFYDAAAKTDGFEAGIRTALQATLASPDFVFRFELSRRPVRAGEPYRISDVALASRLSFFLWGAPPDQGLVELASRGRLSDPAVLREQTDRMLRDPRAETLATRFAAQWLRLQDIYLVQPDAFWFPNFDSQLADAMRRETELFFDYLVREDRSIMDLFVADYTFVNERLARHYGIPNVAGDRFRRVNYVDDTRRGLLGHGSILVLTSVANRTSPVLRGKWVLEAMLGTPPPPPPPDVPDLDETATAKGGRLLTTRERLEMHRANPTCNACHRFMDPVGLALDNFDVTGKWRIRENGAPLDTRGQMWDGRAVNSPADLRQALLEFPELLVRNFAENMMAYALGRRIESYDMPTIRAIARQAAARDYRLSSFVHGVVNSPAFQMQKAE
jgi:mono/diheme cytochrome c family protein